MSARNEYWRFPARQRRKHRLNGYIDFDPSRLLAYEVHSWDGALINQHRTWAEAIQALKAL